MSDEKSPVPSSQDLQLESKAERDDRVKDMVSAQSIKRETQRDWLGVFTLLLLGVSAIVGIIFYKNQPYYVIIPFCTIIVGSWGGLAWEVFGDLGGRWADTVRSWRSANVGLVLGSFFMLYIRLAFPYTSVDHGDAFLWLVSFVGSFLFLNSFLGRSPERGVFVFIGTAITMMVIISRSSWTATSMDDKWFLLACAICFVLGILIPNIVWFHFINSVATAFLIVGLRHLRDDEVLNSEWNGNVGYLFLGILTGSIAVFIKNPLGVDSALNLVAGWVWSFILRFLLKLPAWQPSDLSDAKNLRQTPIHTVVYYETHPQAAPLSCPSADFIPIAQRKDYAFTKAIFGVVGFLDRYLPRARVWTPLWAKNRLASYQLSEYYWYPYLVNFVPIQTSPKAAKRYHNDGQLLQYLVLFGHASTFIRKCETEKEKERGTHVMDFRYMEKYRCKEDYNQVGGQAYFKLDPEAKDMSLNVTGCVMPLHDEFIPLDPKGYRYRQAEACVLSSSFFEVVAGKHLMGIHICMNLVSIALHNAFDTQDNYHPFRVAMNVHFFNHIFVNELTTGHLLTRTGVFAQIFATTFFGLCDYLNDQYVNFEYAVDCKYEDRCEVLDGKFPKHSQLAWEADYQKVYRRYGEEIANACWETDEDVQKDKLIQNFAAEMQKRLIKGLPLRHDFRTKAGVARFIADSVYVVTVRHEVYGTKATMPGMDPSLMGSQIPRDFGLDSIDSYNSVLWVGLATSQANFCKLRQDFKRLLGVLTDEKIRAGLSKAFDNFQDGLTEIQKKFDSDWDYDYMKTMPSQLETGAGY